MKHLIPVQWLSGKVLGIEGLLEEWVFLSKTLYPLLWTGATQEDKMILNLLTGM